MSLVLNLQRKCLDDNVGLQSLLREALVISKKLNLQDFEEWISFELKGYKGEANIPEYRNLHTELKFFNPYQGWIPAISKDEKLSELISSQRVAQPLGELENIFKNEDKSSTLTLSLSSKNAVQLMNIFKTDFQPAQFVSKIQVYGILEQVRNVLLEWTLKLEEDNILGDENLLFSEKEKQAAQNIHIENFNGVMGDVENIGNLSTGKKTTNINNVIHSIDELIKEIKKLNLEDEKQIINELTTAKNNPDDVKAILGKLLSRGAEVSSISSMIIDLLGMFK